MIRLRMKGGLKGIQRESMIAKSILPPQSRIGARLNACKQTVITLGVACFAMLSLSTSVAAQPQQKGRQSNLELVSSDRNLVKAFNWSKRQALAYVFDGDPVGPWYEAALPGRRAFCMRDVSHQVAGAQALGLSKYTHNMLRRFAENISASRDWCSYWEITNQNHPAPVDYKNDAEFWYNLPANFDALDACYRMYLWTGDRTYIEDPVFLNFYNRTVTDYVARWDLSVAHIMARTNMGAGVTYFRGVPSYEESRRDLALGVDLLATQYAGYRSFAAIQALRGDRGAAQLYLASASGVKRLVNTAWWNSSGGYFYAFLEKDRQFHGRAGADLLYRDVVAGGPKTQSALDSLLIEMRSAPASAVESASHYAEILYRYGEPKAAYAEIMGLARPGLERQEYPEVSYSEIGAIVNGLMGINVEPSVSIEDVAQGKQFGTVVRTLSQLTAKTTWAELRNLPIGDGSISVRHDGKQRTIFTNQGTKDLTWEAVFPGSSATLIVNGRSTRAHPGASYHRRVVTWVRVRVQAGNSAQVEVPK
jgi:hypothetical protein